MRSSEHPFLMLLGETASFKLCGFSLEPVYKRTHVQIDQEFRSNFVTEPGLNQTQLPSMAKYRWVDIRAGNLVNTTKDRKRNNKTYIKDVRVSPSYSYIPNQMKKAQL